MKVRFSMLATAAAAGAWLALPGAAMAEGADEAEDRANAAKWACVIDNICGPDAAAAADDMNVVGQGIAVGETRKFDTNPVVGSSAAKAPRAVAAAVPARANLRAERRTRNVGQGLRGGQRVEVPEAVAQGADLFVTFRRGSAEIDSGVTSDMSELAKRMVASISAGNKRVIQIAGHTDATGDEAMNLKLSQDRADAVRKALIDLGVPSDAMQTVGHGESKLIEGYAPTHGVNRRVEVVLVN